VPNFTVVLIILGLAVVIVSILRRIHLPPILGYLIAGACVGPYGLGLLESKEEIRYIAEFGVVFLLFSIGLELSLPKLISMRRALLGLGGMQVLLCTIVVLLTGKWVGLSWAAAFTISGALALSSTAVATKQLVEQDELHQAHGKLALAILLFQDLAAVPFLIIVPALAGSSSDHSVVNILMDRVVMGTLIFLLMLAAGRWLLRPLFHHIAEARSSELFMLTALLVVLSSAFLTEHYGLSAALGAFLAGVMLGETEYAHQIESDIQPFRDILLGLFFISVGLVVDPQVIVDEWKWVAVVLIALIVFKTIVIAALAKLTSTPARTAIRTGLTLAQGSEFGLFLLAIAADKHIIDTQTTQIVISSIVISMAVSPLLIRKSDQIAQWFISTFTNLKKDEDLEEISTPPKLQEDHVILCGFGRVGQTLARFLEQEAIPFVGLDIDPVRLREARAASEPVFFGDPSQESVLAASGIKKAKLLIIAFTHPKQALKILGNARRLNRDIPILVRTTDDSELEALQLAGATEVIPDKLESSLMLASHMLILLGQSASKAHSMVKEVKSNRYKLLRGFYEGEKIGHIEDAEKTFLHAVELTEGAFAIGHTIEEIITEKVAFTLASFSRGGFKCDLPTPYTVLQPGDVLVLEGTKEEIYIAEEKLLQG
jgi:monovalent cation:H+ antiporter-2, CPA2 family